MTYTETDMQGWIGRDLVDDSGDKIGEIAALYYDDQTGQPTWCTVKTGWFGRNVSFVPLAGTTSSGEALISTYSKDKVKDAPNIDPDKHLSPEEERTLYEYYGFEFGDNEQGTDFEQSSGRLGTDTGRDTSGPETDSAMTRSEEELDVARTTRQAGTARMRKWVETEHEAVTVPKSREEVRVEREPVTEANIDKAMDGPRSPRKSTRCRSLRKRSSRRSRPFPRRGFASTRRSSRRTNGSKATCARSASTSTPTPVASSDPRCVR